MTKRTAYIATAPNGFPFHFNAKTAPAAVRFLDITDAELSAAIDRGLAAGTLIAVDDAFLARLAAEACPVCASVPAEVAARNTCTHALTY